MYILTLFSMHHYDPTTKSHKQREIHNNCHLKLTDHRIKEGKQNTVSDFKALCYDCNIYIHIHMEIS